jgi:hypothetical protein
MDEPTPMPTVEERRQELIRFYEAYEDLVETLCDGAQYGPTPALARRYENARSWMIQAYGSLRPFLRGYLSFEAEDIADRESTTGYSSDAFEALLAAATLEDFLLSDDGGMIARIARTREALNLYGEHLRQLAARG